MLKNVSNSFINSCNDIELTLSEYIVLNGVSIPIKAILKDDCYFNGNFIYIQFYIYQFSTEVIQVSF